MIEKLIVTIVGTLITIGVGYLIHGQHSIRKEAKEGREALHKKLNPLLDRMTQIETFHKVNHPGQING